MSKDLISEFAYKQAAEELGVEVAAIKAVAEVESKGSGFTEDGKVKVLFERHKFHEFTHGKFDKDYPDLSNREPGGYGSASRQYGRFSKAFTLDPDAAMKSTSWGRFQIMGFNYEVCGFDSVDEFVDAMKSGEDAQLQAFVQFIKSNHLAAALRHRDWAGFARLYNGEDYRENKYDSHLLVAYNKFKREEPEVLYEGVKVDVVPRHLQTGISENAKSDKPAEIDVPATDVPVVVTTPAVEAPTPVPVEGGGIDDPPKKITNSFWSRIYGAIGGLAGIGTAIKAFWSGNQNAASVAVICITLLALVLIFRKTILDYLRLKIAADPRQINVK